MLCRKVSCNFAQLKKKHNKNIIFLYPKVRMTLPFILIMFAVVVIGRLLTWYRVMLRYLLPATVMMSLNSRTTNFFAHMLTE